MDDSVLRAMARWPDVPAVYGWLSLDRRGRWLLKGEPIANRAALAFIARNYMPDEAGCWFFQNGPQRVFVTLDAAPLVLRLEPGGGPGGSPSGGYMDHRGMPAGALRAVFVDEQGGVWLDTESGPGLLDDRDLDAYSERLCGRDGAAVDEDLLIERVDALSAGEAVDLWVSEGDALLPVTFLPFADAPARLGFVRVPDADQKA